MRNIGYIGGLLTLLVVGACGAAGTSIETIRPDATVPPSTGPATTTAPPATSGTTVATTTPVVTTIAIPSTTEAASGFALEGFDSGRILVGRIPLDVALALTPQQQGQGLMNVTDLPEGAGMLFVFPDEKMGSFWMKDTLIPLDIAFFDANRRLVGALTMVPCTSDPCATYSPGVAFKFAVEANEGAFAGLAPRARLRLADIDS